MARIAGKASEVKYARAERRHTDRDGAHLRIARRTYSRAERREGRKECRVTRGIGHGSVRLLRHAIEIETDTEIRTYAYVR